jgi:hypothetical protein
VKPSLLVLSLFAASLSGCLSQGPQGPQGPAGPPGEAFPTLSNGDVSLPAGATFAGPITTTQVNFGANSLNGAQVAALTGGGNADDLHGHAYSGSAWKKVATTVLKTDLDALVKLYPFTQYQWGTVYNSPTGYEVVHEVTVSSWNGGIRIMTEPYLIGDGTGSIGADMHMGGAAWFFGTSGPTDDACNAQGKLYHQYFQWDGGKITWIFSNGCTGGDWYVRLR